MILRFVKLGTISHATMRPQDLIPKFITYLSHAYRGKYIGWEEYKKHGYSKENSRLALRMSHVNGREDHPYWTSDEASWDLNEMLWNAMQCFAPPLCYFGSHPGDGSDYGFWLGEDVARNARRAGEGGDLDGYAVVTRDEERVNEFLKEADTVVVCGNDFTPYKCWTLVNEIKVLAWTI